MKCVIGGEDVPSSELGLRDMNFGEPVPGLMPLGFELRPTLDEFVSACSEIYRDFADDDRVHGDPDEDSSLLDVRKLGWPPLETLIRSHPGQALRFFHKWMLRNFLGELLGAFGSQGHPRFAANEVTGVHMDGGGIVLTGEALPLPDGSGQAPP